MDFEKYSSIPEDELRTLYKAILLPRLIEEKMLKLLRQGQISKWFSGIGQEAIAVGATIALDEDEYILPLHRNLGVFTSRNISIVELLHQWQGNQIGFTKGRDRSFHFGSLKHHIVGMISHLGAMLPVADGIALAHKLNHREKVTLVFSGEGGTSEGDFHEALNLAAVWDLPVIFLVENNGYGLSTPTKDQFRARNVADKGIGYGIQSKTIEGNNILEVYQTIKDISEQIRRNPKPFLLECKTFRRRGHEEASGVKYVPAELIEEWEKKDPVKLFEQFLIINKKLSGIEIAGIKDEIGDRINEAVKEVLKDHPLEISEENELKDVFKPLEGETSVSEPEGPQENIRFIDALHQALSQALDRYDNLVFMGQDIAEYGGVFKITDGFAEKYGVDRIRNTPISESAPLGAALGLSIGGMKSMVEMQFADFVSCGFNQIANNLAKTYYRWGQNSDVVIRMPTGAGAAAGPFHSQSNEAWFFHCPGLKIVYPSNPADAKGLLLAAFRDPNPVLFFEHKTLYRSIKGDVATAYYETEIGKALTVSSGEDISIITYGWAVHWATEHCEKNNISAEILDLRTLVPWDKEAVKNAVKKTGKVLVLHEDNLSGGIGAEIAAWISEHCFEMLDGPVKRVGSLDTPVPFNPLLEEQYLGKSRLKDALDQLLAY
ncbi:dehydrogenase [bacterium]|nr:dehydrogenase [bacterium]